MKLILAGSISFYEKTKDGKRYSLLIPNHNKLVDNIKQNVKKFNSVLVITNWLNDSPVVNKERGTLFFESLEKSGCKFNTLSILEKSNMHDAQNLVSNADLIYIIGGRVKSAQEFYGLINLGELLKKCNALVIGVSAGAMMLCENIFDYPELFSDEFKPGYEKGLGLVKDILLLPHFDSINKKYQGNAERDVVYEYFLPESFKNTLMGVANDSYIFVNNNKIEYFGDCCKIKNGNIENV